ncbi:MAG: ABC transporter ATP-binding protein [Dehalococcoidales bacterium]
MSRLLIKDVSFSYLNGFSLKNIDLAVETGEMVALIGPNGSGKTTLIKLAAGVLPPGHGEVLLDGASLKSLPRREIARRIAVVPQYFNMPFAFTVGAMVMLGRTPFIRALSGETERDRSTARRAMELTGIEQFSSRIFNELSGGERQKAVLAMALAQEPKLLLLDEPTAHLDINHQVTILELVKELNRKQGVTVVGAIHDLNLAALYFDRLVILKEGAIFAEGSPSAVLTEGTIHDVFGASVHIDQHPSARVPHVIILPREGRPDRP